MVKVILVDKRDRKIGIGEILLQKRAKRKYYSSKTKREYFENNQEEIERGNVIYKTKVGDLIEYESDHIFVCQFDFHPKPNRNEVEDWKWVGLKELEKDLKLNLKN
jgi:isopentenyldiphosphate isomerase